MILDDQMKPNQHSQPGNHNKHIFYELPKTIRLHIQAIQYFNI